MKYIFHNKTELSMFKVLSCKYFIIIPLLSVFLTNCNKYNKADALEYIAKAKKELNSNNFKNAKNMLDSLHLQYPKAFEERKYAQRLLDTIRHKENLFAIETLNPQIDSLQRYVNDLVLKYNKEKQPKFQNQAIYTDKNFPLSSTTPGLYPGVYEDGNLYLTNIYIGPLKHSRLQIINGNDTITTKQLSENGAIHRFSDLGKNYEVMTITSTDAKDIAKIIASDSSKTTNIYLVGAQNNKIQLSDKNRMAIRNAYNLSLNLLKLDSLGTEKEKAKYRNYYLENGKKSIIIEQDTLAN